MWLVTLVKEAALFNWYSGDDWLYLGQVISRNG
jgi:hypothetical protein